MNTLCDAESPEDLDLAILAEADGGTDCTVLFPRLVALLVPDRPL